MALTQNLPPQAYTRDTLVKAIEWISSQPPAVRERASSADLIVSYYMAARRKAAATMEASPSQEAFKADLKHLADESKNFAEPPPPSIPATRAPAPVPAAAAEPPPPAPPVRYPSPVRAPEHRAPEPSRAHGGYDWSADERSLNLAREVQERLNLGHPSEGLRVLIQLGAERFRELFP